MSKPFHLKWNNYPNNLLEFLDDILGTGSFADVTIACEGQSLKAHKIVLSACSQYFKSLFLEHPSKHPIVILKDIKFNDFKALLTFMYSGKISIPPSQTLTFLQTAETLQVKGLEKVIELLKQRQKDSLPVPLSLLQPSTTNSESANSQQTKQMPVVTSLIQPIENTNPESTSSQQTNQIPVVTSLLQPVGNVNPESSNSQHAEEISEEFSLIQPLKTPKPMLLQKKPRKPRQRKRCLVDSDCSEKLNLEATEVREKVLSDTEGSSYQMSDIMSDAHSVCSPSTLFMVSLHASNNLSSTSKLRSSLMKYCKKANTVKKGDVEQSKAFEQTLNVAPISSHNQNNAGQLQSTSHLEDSRKSVDAANESLFFTSDSDFQKPNGSNKANTNGKSGKSCSRRRVSKRKKTSKEIISVIKEEPWKRILHMCSVCCYTSGYKEDLISHNEFHMKTATRCEFCKIDFAELNNSETMAVVEECEVCDHRFCSRMALLKHKLNHH